MLFDSMAQSHINYGNAVWTCTNHTKLQRILIKQKQISRMILFQNRNIHARPLMRKLRALNIFQTNLFQILTLMYKSKNELLPKIFQKLFINLSHRYPTRFLTDAYTQATSHTKQTAFRISSRVPYLWNLFKDKIPSNSDVGLSEFKYTMKRRLLEMKNEIRYF